MVNNKLLQAIGTSVPDLIFTAIRTSDLISKYVDPPESKDLLVITKIN
jgi:hypothetical protein